MSLVTLAWAAEVMLKVLCHSARDSEQVRSAASRAVLKESLTTHRKYCSDRRKALDLKLRDLRRQISKTSSCFKQVERIQNRGKGQITLEFGDLQLLAEKSTRGNSSQSKITTSSCSKRLLTQFGAPPSTKLSTLGKAQTTRHSPICGLTSSF